MFNASGGESANPNVAIGAALRDVFPQEVLEDLEPLLRRADRMGTTTTQLEMALHPSPFNAAVTVATLQTCLTYSRPRSKPPGVKWRGGSPTKSRTR
jgi:hypothetical protein